jgi:hypothetical protein
VLDEGVIALHEDATLILPWLEGRDADEQDLGGIGNGVRTDHVEVVIRMSHKKCVASAHRLLRTV